MTLNISSYGNVGSFSLPKKELLTEEQKEETKPATIRHTPINDYSFGKTSEPKIDDYSFGTTKVLTEEQKGEKIYLDSSGQAVFGKDGNPVTIAEEKKMLYAGKEYEEPKRYDPSGNEYVITETPVYPFQIEEESKPTTIRHTPINDYSFSTTSEPKITETPLRPNGSDYEITETPVYPFQIDEDKTTTSDPEVSHSPLLDTDVQSMDDPFFAAGFARGETRNRVEYEERQREKELGIGVD